LSQKAKKGGKKRGREEGRGRRIYKKGKSHERAVKRY
jgi:hypothetical protein